MKPKRIFIVRHGQSIGNTNKEIYKSIPDYVVHLTDLGKQQTFEVGTKIGPIIGENSNIQFYVSPYWRTRESYHNINLGIKETVNIASSNYYEDARLREQEWGQRVGDDGGYKTNEEGARDAYGHFYYRFGNGESCADVYDRTSDFMGTMFRDFEKPNFPENVVIIAHGMTNRVFLMRFFHCSVEEFETWKNPRNAEFYLLEKQDNDKYVLKTPLKIHTVSHDFQYKFQEGNHFGSYDKRKLPINYDK